jgi:hypothetical protein
VLYKECYRGIDTAFYGHGSQLEYDFEVSPAAQPSEIAFLVNDADEIKVRADGGLDIIVGGKSFAQLLPPVAYQLVGSARKSVRISYLLSSDRTVAFQIGEYDRSSKLIIDPVVAYANYLPGAVIDVSAAKIDSSGNLIPGFPRDASLLFTERSAAAHRRPIVGWRPAVYLSSSV